MGGLFTTMATEPLGAKCMEQAIQSDVELTSK